MNSIIVLQTDFTFKEAAVSAMYGVIKSIDRSLEVYDSTHEIPQYDIYSASFRLFQPMMYWPEKTVFVSVVDPGVGSSRKSVIALTKNGYYVVTPNNGTLTHVEKVFGIEKLVEINTEKYSIKKGGEISSVFHGRDVYAYCGALLASGNVKMEEFGEELPLQEIVRFELIDFSKEGDVLTGMLDAVDPNFGNAWTNIPFSQLSKDVANVKIFNEDELIFDEDVAVNETFSQVSKGELTIYKNEYLNIGIAINQGSFIQKYPIAYGVGVRVEVR